jgi:hypothetical protein
MRTPPAISTFETKTLERLQIGVTQAVGRELPGLRIDSLEASDTLGFLKNQLVMMLRAHVWSDPDRHHNKVHKVTYTQAHPTWKHHLVASLPEGSFVRGFFHYFWDIPFDYANTRVTEKIEVDVRTIFPENTMHYPEHLGRVHYPVQITPLGAELEAYYGA